MTIWQIIPAHSRWRAVVVVRTLVADCLYCDSVADANQGCPLAGVAPPSPADLLAACLRPAYLGRLLTCGALGCHTPVARAHAGCASGRRAAAGSTGGRRSCRTCATRGGACRRCPSWAACTGSTSRRSQTSYSTARWAAAGGAAKHGAALVRHTARRRRACLTRSVAGK